MSSHCHEIVAQCAKDMAQALYEHLALQDNAWYKRNKNMASFVERVWPTLLDEARTTLAGMLSQSLPQELKEQIFEALIHDNELKRRGTGKAPQLRH